MAIKKYDSEFDDDWGDGLNYEYDSEFDNDFDPECKYRTDLRSDYYDRFDNGWE